MGQVAYEPHLKYEQPGGHKNVDRLRTSPPFLLLSSSPRENAAHAHLRPLAAGGVRHYIANAPRGFEMNLLFPI